MLGKTQDMQLKDAILRLQKRLLGEMKELPAGYSLDMIKRPFSEGNLPEMIQTARVLHDQFTRKWSGVTWPPQLFHLLRMCSGNLGAVYSLSALGSKFQAERVRRADVVENFELSDVEILEASQSTYVCPISDKEEQDIVLLVKKPTAPLLAGDASEIVNVIITNPLAAVRYPEFCRSLAALIDHPIALRAMKEAEEAGQPFTSSPISHEAIVGGFCLGAHEAHCRATDSVMAQITAEGKRVGNSDLWFLLVWHLIENGYAPQAREVLPQIREHLLFRMRRHLGTFTMTNVPYFPITFVPMGVACWCTISARITRIGGTYTLSEFLFKMTRI
jgi:hypothetical protein